MEFVPAINGQHYDEPRTSAQADDLLDKPLTLGYKATLPAFSLWDRGGGGTSFVQSMLIDVPRMLVHPIVRNAMRYYRGGIACVKFTVEADSSKIGAFAHANFSRFWERSLDQAQHVYNFGWGGYEINYRTENGIRHFDGLHDFFPFDVWAVTNRNHYAGIAVDGVSGTFNPGPRMGGSLLLWGPQRWPAKGFWLSHQREYDRFYGMTQLYGAWLPWRRLATADGAEEVADGANYRAGYQGPKGRFPAKGSRKRGAGQGPSDYDENREIMRQICEASKAGISVALPNTRDEKGEFEWDIEFPGSVLDTTPLTNNCEYLQKQIQIGLGVPPELLEASETGSGYSGRKIPLQGFYTTQLANARNLVHAFQWQVIDPLIRWNFGPGHKVTIRVQLVMPEGLEPKQQGGQSPPGQAEGGGAPEQPQTGGGLLGNQSASGGGTQGNWQPFTGPKGGKWQRNTQTGTATHLATGEGAEGRWLSLLDGHATTLGQFVEGEHPRGQPQNSGEFAAKNEQTTQPEASAANRDLAAKWLSGASHLSPELKARYGHDLAVVLDKMPPRCRAETLEALDPGWGGKMLWYADSAAVTAQLEKEIGRKEKAKVGGFVSYQEGAVSARVHLDGGSETDAKNPERAQGIYAHELGHAVDVGRKYSNDVKWKAAWKAELFNGKTLLSRYARESATEGFAELHRALCERGVAATVQAFPKCCAFLKAKGLI